MSIAGKRAGLDGSRSNLFYEAIRIVKEMRDKTNGKYPRFIVWENVPGAFSSNGGEDFKAVLKASVPSKKIKLIFLDMRNGRMPEKSWQTITQSHGGFSMLNTGESPSEEKRIYLVADFGGGCAGKILFESEGLSGYSKKGSFPWQRAAKDTQNSIGATGATCLNDHGGNRIDITENVTATLRAEAHHPPCVMESAGFCTEHSAKARSIGFEKEVSPTLRVGAVPAAVYENHGQDTRFKGAA